MELISNLLRIGFALAHETEKAALISCPAGKFWVLKSNMRTLFYASQPARITKTGLEKAIKTAAQFATKEINDNWVVVRIDEVTERGGAKVSFLAIREDMGNMNWANEPAKERKKERKHVYVPKSYIVEMGGKSAVSLKTLREKKKGAWRIIPGGITTETEIFNWLVVANSAEIEQLDAAQKESEKLRQASKMRLINNRIKPNSGGSLDSAPPAPALPAKTAKPKPEKKPDETISSCTVQWVEWKKKDQRFSRQDFVEYECSAKRYGKKWVIRLSSGEEFVKMAGKNLVITPNPSPEGNTTS